MVSFMAVEARRKVDLPQRTGRSARTWFWRREMTVEQRLFSP